MLTGQVLRKNRGKRDERETRSEHHIGRQHQQRKVHLLISPFRKQEAHLHKLTLRCLESNSAASLRAMVGVALTDASFCRTSLTCTKQQTYALCDIAAHYPGTAGTWHPPAGTTCLPKVEPKHLCQVSSCVHGLAGVLICSTG